MSNVIDQMNPETMRSGSIVDSYADLSGLLQERSALRQITEAARGKPILDFGVGGGDSRDLQAISGKLVFHVSSACHGIFKVGHADRPKVRGENFRVLQPGGFFVLAMHNPDYPTESQLFWCRGPEYTRGVRPGTRRTMKRARPTLACIANRTRNRRDIASARAHSILKNCSPYCGAILHCIVPANQRKQIEALGREHDTAECGADGMPINDPLNWCDFATLAKQQERWLEMDEAMKRAASTSTLPALCVIHSRAPQFGCSSPSFPRRQFSTRKNPERR